MAVLGLPVILQPAKGPVSVPLADDGESAGVNQWLSMLVVSQERKFSRPAAIEALHAMADGKPDCEVSDGTNRPAVTARASASVVALRSQRE
jgi:hypothetical protein